MMPASAITLPHTRRNACKVQGRGYQWSWSYSTIIGFCLSVQLMGCTIFKYLLHFWHSISPVSLGLSSPKAVGHRWVHGCRPGRCLGGVSVVSRWCLLSRWCVGLGGVSVVSRWCLGGVSVMSRWCLGGVSVVSRRCLGGVSVVSR